MMPERVVRKLVALSRGRPREDRTRQRRRWLTAGAHLMRPPARGRPGISGVLTSRLYSPCLGSAS